MKKLLFASKNKGKLKEVEAIFKASGITIVSLLDFPHIPDIIESGSTFEENAKIKAAAMYEAFQLPVISDDSGIMVEQLNGAPGVYSARLAGEHATDADNNTKLLKELSAFPHPHKAAYVCCAVYYDGKTYQHAIGKLEGRIIETPKGDNGFGYDPYFVPEGYDLTMAELAMDEKNRISHRGKAFAKLHEVIEDLIS